MIAGDEFEVYAHEKDKQFFFEKKNQKTFVIMACAAGENRDSDIKVFCFFSSEKKILPLLNASMLSAPREKPRHSAMKIRLIEQEGVVSRDRFDFDES